MNSSTTSQVTTLPLIPRPPHDPTSLLLNFLVGWQAASLDQVELTSGGSMQLMLAPDSQRSLGEAGGSFGGLTTPANMALAGDGNLYLLDAESLQLKVFDRCSCSFQSVRCFGGAGTGPRQLNDPHGIAICSGNLFVCDTGNHRLSVFALNGFVLRGFWLPDAKESGLTNAWEPFDLAFDPHGKVYVTDPANGCIHVFSASGSWQKTLSGLGEVTWIAVDCQDNLYVVVSGPPDSVIRIDAGGARAPADQTPEAIATLFPRLPFEVDAEGLLHLGTLCEESGEITGNDKTPAIKCPPQQPVERGLFDLNGNPVIRCSTPTISQYQTSGKFLSESLDSAFYRCQWHRVIVRGDIPPGSRISIFTHTAEAELTNDQIQSLDENQWDTNQAATEVTDCKWDCLVRSGGGRFLWLKIVLQSNGKVTPRIDSIEIEFPRISLRRYLPAVFGEEPTSADFTDRFLSLFDTTLRSIESEVDRQARFYDPLSTPAERDPKTGADFLSWLGSWIGVTLDRNWSEQKRRQFLKRAGSLFDLRGTPEGLRQELLVFLDMAARVCCNNPNAEFCCTPAPANCGPTKRAPSTWEPPPLILEHFKLRRWLFLGAGRIGDQAVLWGKRIINRSQLNDGAQVGLTQLKTVPDQLHDPFSFYAHKFTVFVPASYRQSETQRKGLENILRGSRPAGTVANVEYVEPRFRIGFQSMIGFDSVVGRYPGGVTLNQTPLSRASVLTKPANKQGGPGLEIGNQSRIGSTTRLD